MTRAPELRTARLILREWREEDFAAFAEVNADARVMEFFPECLTRAKSDALAKRLQLHFDCHGFGLWAVEIPTVAPFVGFTGLSKPSFDAHFTPCVEIGWRIAAPHWGHGYATEAARAALQFGFGKLGLPEIVSFTTPGNRRSIRVMEKLGMHRNESDDFDHPSVPRGHRFRRHVLYRLRRDAWAAAVDPSA